MKYALVASISLSKDLVFPIETVELRIRSQSHLNASIELSLSKTIAIVLLLSH